MPPSPAMHAFLIVLFSEAHKCVTMSTHKDLTSTLDPFIGFETLHKPQGTNKCVKIGNIETTKDSTADRYEANYL